jgi:Ca2+-binding EF-hand superfamily protein
MIDLDGNDLISRQEWNAGFDIFDTDKDDFINRTEFSDVTQPVFVFETLDTDGDGMIIREEYNKGLDVMDINKNGKVCKSQFNCVCFVLLDRDGDGQLSREEYEVRSSRQGPRWS